MAPWVPKLAFAPTFVAHWSSKSVSEKREEATGLEWRWEGGMGGMWEGDLVKWS